VVRCVVLTVSLVAASVCLLAQDFKAHEQHAVIAISALKAEESKEGKDCSQARDQHEQNICTAEVAEAADRNLALFYDNLKAIIDGDAQKKLQQSQDAWLQYRASACDAVFEFYKDGSIRNSERARCAIRLTRQRMRDLDVLYEGPLHH
jgi:uncharacterized protein YecT (DUF1311 family)